MKNKLVIQIVVVLGIAALFASAGIRTHSLNFPNPGDIGKAVAAVVLLAGAFDLFLWRWVPLPGRPPKLRGTWKMLLAPIKGQPDASMAQKTCYLSVWQTASTVSAKLLFDDAASEVTTAVLVKRGAGRALLFFYDHNPKNPTSTSPRRKGAVALDIGDGELDGRYWNDVGTWGTLVSEGRARKIHETYRAASRSTYA